MPAIATPLLVRVVDEARRPLPGVVVEGFVGIASCAAVTTDARGEAGLRHPLGVPELVVAQIPGTLHPIVAVPPGAREVVVPRPPLTFRGSMLVDGAAPGRSLELRLFASSQATLSIPAVVPTRLARRLAERLIERGVPFTVAADGRFDLFGLPVGWDGSIGLPEGLVPAHGPAPRGGVPHGRVSLSLPMPAPNGADLVLELRALPVLRGRVVDALGQGLPSAEVELRSASRDRHVPLDDDGTFAHAFDPGTRAFVLLQARWAGVSKEVRIERPFAGEIVAPELVFPAMVRRRVIVVDARGEPIPEAIIETFQVGGLCRTDAAGEAMVPAMTDVGSRLRIAAAGQQAFESGAFVADDAPFRVVMTPGISATIRVLGPPGREPGRTLELGAATCLLRVPDWRGYASFRALMPNVRFPQRERPFTATATTDDQGEVVLHDLAAGATFEVAVIGASRRELVTGTFEIGEEPRQVFELSVPEESLRSLRGRIEDASGAAVTGALVTLDSGSAPSLTTGGDGRFRFDEVTAAACNVTVEAPGYAALVERCVPSDDGREHVLVLQSGYACELFIEDENGAPQQGIDRIYAAQSHHFMVDVTRIATAHYRMERLSGEEVHVVVFIGDRRHGLVIRPQETSVVRMQIPKK